MTRLVVKKHFLHWHEKKTFKKKEIESYYFEKAQSISSILPDGEVLYLERPDIVIKTSQGSIGIELTELSVEEPRALAGKLTGAVDDAKASYNKIFPSKPLDVVVTFSLEVDIFKRKSLSKDLLEFVTKNDISNMGMLPKPYTHIGVYPAEERIEPEGRWQCIRAFSTIVASEKMIRETISKKNNHIREYQKKSDRVWLLIINDQFMGPGEVNVRPEDLLNWKFSFDFEKVLLFSHQAGGGGEVFELQRM